MLAFEIDGIGHKRYAGAALLAIAGFVFSGWMAGMPALTTWGAASVATSPIAALGFAIAGSCLVQPDETRNRTVLLCGALLVALGLVDLLPTVMMTDFPRGGFLGRYADARLASEIASAAFVMSGASLIVESRNVTLARILGGLVGLIGLLSLLDVTVTLGEHHLPGFTNIALPSAVGFLLLGAGLVMSAGGGFPEIPMKAMLGLLVIASLLPAFVFMTAQTQSLNQQRLDAIRLASANAAEDVKSLIDVRMSEQVALLRGLATSPALTASDRNETPPAPANLTLFYAQMKAAVGSSGGWIILTDAAGNQLVNSRRPQQDWAGPPLGLPTIAQAYSEGRPMISDLHTGVSGDVGPQLTVSYPVAERNLVLNWRSPVGPLSAALARIAPRGWIYAVADRQGVLVARSREAQAWVGQSASEPFRSTLLSTPNGAVRSVTLEGLPVFSSWRRLGNGWTAVAAVEEAVVDGPGREQLRRLTIGATLMALLGLSFATLGAVLISRPLLKFSALDEDRAGSDARLSQVSVVREINALAQTLIDAARDRRRSGEALAESEARLKRFVDQAPAAIAMFDRDMRYLAASQRWLAYFAPDEGDLVGRLHHEVFPAISAQWKEYHRRGLAGEVLEAENDLFVGLNGQQHFLRWELRPWRTVDGDIGGITIFAEDVTERAAAELALRESEARMKAIVDTATDAIVVIDESGRIESVNGAAEKMFGYSAAEAVGCNVRILMTDADRERHGDYMQAYRQTGEAKIIGIGREVIGRRKDGTNLPVDLSITEWVVHGRAHFTGIMRDITSRKEREAHVRLVMRELSHRTKNALAVVQAMAWQTSRSSQSVDEFQRQFGQRVEGLSRSIGLLVRSEWEGVCVRDLVSGQLAPFLDDAATRLLCSGPVVNLKPNAAQDLGLVLHELATNASKYGALSVPGGRVETMWTSLLRDGTKLFQFDWKELGGPDVVPPASTGFGSVLIKDLVARTYGAEIEMTFAAEGLCWRFVVEKDRMIA